MKEGTGRKSNNDKKKVLFNNRIIFPVVLVSGILLIAIGFFLILRTPKINIKYSGDQMNEFWSPEGGEYLTVRETLPKGIYDITVKYEAVADLTASILYVPKSHNTAYSETPTLSMFSKELTFNVWANEVLEEFQVRVKSISEEQTYFIVDSIEIKTSRNSYIYRIFRFILALLLILAVAVFVAKRRELSKYSLQIMGLGIIVFIASIPIFTRFVLVGHDLNFHLLRIEGLKEAFLIGDIPVKVQSNWSYGYGYAVSAMYGDITLVIPALMRVIGFTIQTSYKTFIFLVNLATALSAYYCFIRMSRGKKSIALLATFLYTCAPYRFCCIYIRGAFGEYSGMMFLPLIFLWFYEIYMGDIEDESLAKKYILPVIGFTGILQTHILTCFMIAIFMGIFMIVMWRKTFRKKMILHMVYAAGWTLLCNLWFLVPFFTFLKEPLRVHVDNGYSTDLQLFGVSIAELFAQHSSGNAYFNWAYMTNLGSRMSMPLGNGFVILLICYAYILWNRKAEKKDIAPGLLAGLGLLSAFMATNLFPYDFIEKTLPFVSKFITRVNVPFRYITTAVAILSIFAVFFFGVIEKEIKKKYILLIFLITLFISADQSLEYLYKVLYNGPIKVYYDDNSLNSNDLVGYEYLYENTDYHIIQQTNFITSEDVSYEDVQRTANRFYIKGINTGNNPKLELPLYYYPGYVAKADDGTKLTIDRGTNNRLRILFDPGFTGNVYVRYSEPILWRLCEVISLLSMIAVVYFEIKRRKALSHNKA